MKRLDSFDVKFLKGVGEARASLLNRELDIRSVRDLLYTFPYRYHDRSRIYRISEFQGDMPYVQVVGSFIGFKIEGEGRRQRLSATFTDGKGLMQVTWFSMVKRMSEAYRVGKVYILFGKPSLFRNVWAMTHPEIEEFNPANPPRGMEGVYSVTETMRKKQLTSKMLRKLIYNALSLPAVSSGIETLPAEIVSSEKLMSLADALRNIHFPESLSLLQKAKERLKFEELYYIQLSILRFAVKRGNERRGAVFGHVGEKFMEFYNEVLPFPLTGAQKRVIKEIRGDMSTGKQMNRLLQGDVGCGKTLVAFMCALIGVDNGFQVCLMAPTEILATQHYENLREWGSRIGVNVALLTGSVRTAERRMIHTGLENGEINILVGTHALIEETVVFRNLGLAIIDEQHRFGVAQRARLWKKNRIAPHVLVMTATPIPRTLAMTVYGDLDVSVIDELPPGRKPVETLLRYDDNRRSVEKLVFDQLRQGRQVYIVYPLVHENEKLSLKSLEEGYKAVSETFRDYRVCFVHGQLNADEKKHQMDLFVSGEARIMVATTVIEVGVNVPNASLMVIENAERFGLSQLHQLRGRVGRGADKSYCILMSHFKISADTRKRLEIMTQTTDGFVVAEADMQLRGPGDMEGTQQSGLAFNLRIANLVKDGLILQTARDAARRTVELNPSLSGEKPEADSYSPASIALLERELSFRFGRKADWSEIS